MVYADGSNPSVRKDIGVRLPSPAHLCLSLLPREGPGSAPRNVVVEFAWSPDLCIVRVSGILGFAARCRDPHARFRSCAGGESKAYVFRPTHAGFKCNSFAGSFVITGAQTPSLLA